LKRLIQKTIADPVAILILDGKVADGGGITVDVDGEEFVILAHYSMVD
jgi:ATP-dependent Clp protease ATP-binding subunit ClpA